MFFSHGATGTFTLHVKIEIHEEQKKNYMRPKHV